MLVQPYVVVYVRLKKYYNILICESVAFFDFLEWAQK